MRENVLGLTVVTAGRADHPHRRPRAQVERRLRPHAAVRRLRRHARHHHRDPAAALRRARGDLGRRCASSPTSKARCSTVIAGDAARHPGRADRAPRRRADGRLHPLLEARRLRGEADAVLRVPRQRGRASPSRRRRCRRSPRSTAAARSNGRRSPRTARGCGRRGTRRTTRRWRCARASRASPPTPACRSRGSPTASSRRRPTSTRPASSRRSSATSATATSTWSCCSIRTIAGERAKAEALAERVSLRAIAMGGTCTGEHGIGVHKLDALVAEHGEAVDLMRTIKRALDPHDIMNPGQDGAPSDRTTSACTRSTSATRTTRRGRCAAGSRRSSRGAPFREVMVPLSGDGTPNPANRAFSPSGARAVPARRRRRSSGIRSRSPSTSPSGTPACGPPTRSRARGRARSRARCTRDSRRLRNEMTMCIRERVDVRPWSPALAADIARVDRDLERRRGAASARGGPYLCGAFSLADAFYAPVAFRFRTYGVAPGRRRGRLSRRAARASVPARVGSRGAAETAIIEADEPRVIYRDKLAAKRPRARGGRRAA